MSSGQPSTSRLEIAHVLFTDIVAYSRLPMDQQPRVLATLQQLVSSTKAFRDAEAEGQLIRLPTGDGMALVFFGDPEAPVQCAVELSQALRAHPELRLRMGINTGPVYRVQDINANRNVSGGGINMAQRVMDCGDGGHILLSKSTAEVVSELEAWNAHLHDLGEAEVKHGVRIHVFNFHGETAGNPAVPSKLRAAIAKRRTRIAARIGVAAALAFVGFAVWYLASGRGHLTTGIHQRRSIAVLGFRNTGRADAAWISNVLAEQLTTELGAGEKLRIVPGEDVARVKNDLALAEMDSLGPDTLTRIRKNLGSDLLVLGSYLDVGGQLRLDIRIQDAVEGETIASWAETGTERGILELVARAGLDMREKLGLGEISSEQAAQVRASRPTNPEAARYYADGLAKLRTFDALAARDLLQKAVTADPNYAMAHSALSTAWEQLGYDSKAADEAQKAVELSANLPRESRLAIEAHAHEASGRWEEAVKIYGSLWTVFGDDLDIGLRLATVQTKDGKAKDALQAVDRMRKFPAPARNDPRIDLAEADALNALSDYKHVLTATTHAAEKARNTGARLLLAQATWQQCWAQRNLGDFASARAAGEQARATFTAAGDLQGAARSLTCLANVLADQGDVAAARGMHEEALTLARQIGALGDIAGASINIARLLANQQDLAEATKYYQQALAVAQEAGDKSDVLLAQNGLAANLLVQGDLTRAHDVLTQSLATATEAGDQSGMVEALTNLGLIAFQLGDIEIALEHLQQAVAKSRKLGMESSTATALILLGDVQLAHDDLAEAEKGYREALQIGEKLGTKGDAASAQLALANLLLEKQQPAEAEAAARQAMDEFRTERNVNEEAAAHNVIAQARLAQGRLAEAQTEIDAARTLQMHDQTTWLAVEITAARLQAKTGKPAAALHQLDDLLAKARRMRLLGSELQLRWAQAEAQVAAGNRNAAATTLKPMEADATRAGFTLLARKAGALRQSIH
jgi:tetratricopeptide (TPR) repeat protein